MGLPGALGAGMFRVEGKVSKHGYSVECRKLSGPKSADPCHPLGLSGPSPLSAVDSLFTGPHPPLSPSS